MSTITTDIERIEQIELRPQMHYWRVQHALATEREAAWKEKAQKLESFLRQRDATIAEQDQKIEALKARIAWLSQQVFGQKTKTPNDSTIQTRIYPNLARMA